MAPGNPTWTAQSVTELAQLFSDLGRELLSERGLDGTRSLITARSVKLLPAAQHAAISRGRRDRFETVASTGELPLQIDQIQYDLGSGPCVDAAVQVRIYRTGELATDPRWPEFGRRAAAEHGVHSMLSVRLFLEDDDLVAAFSKKVENLAHAVSLHSMHYNFARPHKTLTKANNGCSTCSPY